MLSSPGLMKDPSMNATLLWSTQAYLALGRPHIRNQDATQKLGKLEYFLLIQQTVDIEPVHYWHF
jgi:hypothetical protein